MENVFDSLCSALSEPSIKTLFLTAEGPDLMVMMMKSVFFVGARSDSDIDYAIAQGEAAVARARDQNARLRHVGRVGHRVVRGLCRGTRPQDALFRVYGQGPWAFRGPPSLGL
jgi:hypothetical protein